MKDRYRIENIQGVTLNGRKVKLFHAYEYDSSCNAYIHVGQFDAPAETPDSQLENFIDD